MIPWSHAFLTRSASGSLSNHFHSAWMLPVASGHTDVTRPDGDLGILVAPHHRQPPLHAGEVAAVREDPIAVPVEAPLLMIMRGRSALTCLRMGVVMRVRVFIASFLSR